MGLRPVFGQVLFRLGAMPVLELSARSRIAEIVAACRLDVTPVEPAVRVGSVNDEETRQVLAALSPSVVVVVGTRIIGPSTLASVDAPFVNLHTGITPRYRGVHGGYWALVEGRPDLVGSTVHLVDRGIDTGLVLRQATFEITEHDSFATYPYLHLAVGVPLVLEVVNEVLAGNELLGRVPIDSGESKLWHHPTLWGYLSVRRKRAIR
jgi:methionyl-tRNA formyltransferase